MKRFIAIIVGVIVFLVLELLASFTLQPLLSNDWSRELIGFIVFVCAGGVAGYIKGRNGKWYGSIVGFISSSSIFIVMFLVMGYLIIKYRFEGATWKNNDQSLSEYISFFKAMLEVIFFGTISGFIGGFFGEKLKMSRTPKLKK